MDFRFKHRRDIPFLIFSSFLVSFVISRVFIFFFEGHELWIGGYHFHHFFLGILFLLVSGWVSINIKDEKHVPRVTAVFYGAGLGLLADEAGLLFTLGDYWSDLTYTVFLIIALVLLIFLFISDYLKKHYPIRPTTGKKGKIKSAKA